MRRLISVVLMFTMLASLLLLGGCMNKRERAIRDELNADGTLVSIVAGTVNDDYINTDGFLVEEVSVTDTTDNGNGTTYTCDVTVQNEYIAVTVPCAVEYSAEDEFVSYSQDGKNWTSVAVGAIDISKITESDLPNGEEIEYSEFRAKKAKFDEDDQTCTAIVHINADSRRVIANGDIQIQYKYEGGRWSINDYSSTKDFSMSWDIGGLWEGDEYKWNKKSTLTLKYGFTVNSIESDGTVKATVHSHIIEGKNDQDDVYEAEGKLDFTKLSLTLDYENTAGPCQICVTIDGKYFEGTVIGTEDNFEYYHGRFRITQ